MCATSVPSTCVCCLREQGCIQTKSGNLAKKQVSHLFEWGQSVLVAAVRATASVQKTPAAFFRVAHKVETGSTFSPLLAVLCHGTQSRKGAVFQQSTATRGSGEDYTSWHHTASPVMLIKWHRTDSPAAFPPELVWIQPKAVVILHLSHETTKTNNVLSTSSYFLTPQLRPKSTGSYWTGKSSNTAHKYRVWCLKTAQ